MTKDALYTLEELAQAAQVTPRTIRYYAAKGLLPAPQSRGRFALYGPTHLNRLRLIALLKQALLPIAAMRDGMLHLTDTQVLALLASGLDAEVTSEGELRDELNNGEQDSAAGAASVGESVIEAAESYQFLLDALTARKDASLSPVSVREGERKEVKGKRRKEEKNSQSTIRHPQSTIANPQSSAETWQRIWIAPGVELHVCVSGSSPAREPGEPRIAEIRALFASQIDEKRSDR